MKCIRSRSHSWEPPAAPGRHGEQGLCAWLCRSWPGPGMRQDRRKDVHTPPREARASLPAGRSGSPQSGEEGEPRGRRGAERRKGTSAPQPHPARGDAEGSPLGRCAQSRSPDARCPRDCQKRSDPLCQNGRDPEASTFVGLINQGMTCYLNTLLQCLFLTPEFLHRIQKSPKPSKLEQALNQVFHGLEEQRGAVQTRPLTACLSLGYGQQDVGEVFLYLLESLGREDLQEVFQSEVEKVIRCAVCDNEDHIPSGGRMLLLPLASHAQLCGLQEEQVPQKLSWESAGLTQDTSALSFPQIQNFDDEDNLLFCEHCNCKTPASEEKRFLRLPKILILQVRELTFENGKFYKTQEPVCVPEVLTLQIGPKEPDPSHSTDSRGARPSLAPEQKRYRLYAMCNHSGDCDGGHYTALIRPCDQEHWYRFNDRHVQRVGTLPGPHALRPEVPYLLMYRCEDSGDRPEPQAGGREAGMKAGEVAAPEEKASPPEVWEDTPGADSAPVPQVDWSYPPGDSFSWWPVIPGCPWMCTWDVDAKDPIDYPLSQLGKALETHGHPLQGAPQARCPPPLHEELSSLAPSSALPGAVPGPPEMVMQERGSARGIQERTARGMAAQDHGGPTPERGVLGMYATSVLQGGPTGRPPPLQSDQLNSCGESIAGLSLLPGPAQRAPGQGAREKTPRAMNSPDHRAPSTRAQEETPKTAPNPAPREGPLERSPPHRSDQLSFWEQSIDQCRPLPRSAQKDTKRSPKMGFQRRGPGTRLSQRGGDCLQKARAGPQRDTQLLLSPRTVPWPAPLWSTEKSGRGQDAVMPAPREDHVSRPTVGAQTRPERTLATKIQKGRRRPQSQSRQLSLRKAPQTCSAAPGCRRRPPPISSWKEQPLPGCKTKHRAYPADLRPPPHSPTPAARARFPAAP